MLLATTLCGSQFMFVPTGDPYTTSYYVDSVAGSDSNDGLTPLTPFQTLTKMNTITPSIPQWTAINLKRGSEWDQTPGSATNFLVVLQQNCVIRDYGDPTAPLPIIDGRVTMAAGSFTLTSGKTYTYQYPFIALNTGAELQSIWEDGVRLTMMTSQAAVETTAGSYYSPPEASFVQGSPTNLYVHASDNSNPATNGKVYTTQGIERAILMGSETAPNGKVYNVEVRAGCHHNGNIQMGRNSYANGVVSRWGTIHSVYTDSGFFVNCTSLDCEQGFDFVANKGSASDGFIEMNGCVCDVDQTSAQIHGPGFFVHGTSCTTIRYINCVSRNHATGFGLNGIGQNGQQILIQGCTAKCATSGPQQFNGININTLDFGGGFTCTATITDCLTDGFGLFFNGFSLQANTICNFTKCRGVIRGSGASAFQWRNSTNFNVTYSSFYTNTSTDYAFAPSNNGTALTANHCVFDGFAFGIQSFNTLTYSADHNVWHYTAGSTPSFRIAGTLYSSFSSYQSAFEPGTSSNADPLWVQTPSTADNFAVQSISPANPLLAGWSNAP
jgi:hypothetical protein